MNKSGIFALAMILTMTVPVMAGAADAKKSALNVRSQEVIGKIVGVDVDGSTIDLEYEADEQTHQKKIDTFYITDATTIDVATVKSTIKDLKAGTSVLLEYAPMPDGAKVVESVWVKKS